jgi:predicted metalloprotease with PDZ domain
MDVKARLQSNSIEIELCRQAIQAKRIRLALESETPVERRIRELERNNALLKAVIADEPAVVIHRVLCRTHNGRVQEVRCD